MSYQRFTNTIASFVGPLLLNKPLDIIQTGDAQVWIKPLFWKVF